MCAGVEYRTARRGREGQPWYDPVLIDMRVLTDAVVQVADGVTVHLALGRAGPLHRPLPQPRVAHAAHVVAGTRIPERANLLEDLFAR
ncbi:Uncharacterised protein [Mycobacteroides abscessus subsp. abscessus]|nr:Uncharacterised protein [Mycobacteroides abscessus subsp. abscessus]